MAAPDPWQLQLPAPAPPVADRASGAMSARLLDAKAAAALLGVPPSWVLAQARADRIPHVRFGRYVRFDEAELERWWRSRLQGPVVKDGYPARDP
jgi:excisionase family DNA binding protein